jgi:hypothetical protein
MDTKLPNLVQEGWAVLLQMAVMSVAFILKF